MVRNAVDLLTKALAELGPETEPGQAVMKAVQSLSKHVPQGATTPGAQHAGMESFMMQQRQMAPLLATLAAMKGGGAGNAGAGAPAPQPPPPENAGSGGSPLNPGG